MATSKTLELSIKIAGRMDKSLTAAINGTQSKIGSLTKSISNIGTVGLATMGAVATAAAVGIAGCTKEAQALESAMAPVVRYVDGLADASGAVSDAIADNGKTFKQNYGALKTYIQDLSTEIPRTTDQLTAMSAALGQSGIGVDQQLTTGYLRDTAVTATAMDLDDQTAGNYVAKWEASFNFDHKQVMELMDQINYLGAHNATTAAEIAQSVNSAASMGQIAGVDPAATAAMATAIKADARWSGRAYSKDTKECYDGVTYATITAPFRAYDSWAESVADHSAFLLANKRYAAVVGERDYKVACKAIKAAGYATDPGYPQKLIGLIEKYGLTVYDGKAKQEDKASMNISITKKTSTHNTTAAAGRAIRYIVVHYTAGVTSKPGSAAGTASYFGGTSKQVSADFIVDDGGAVQYNGDIRNRYTWHCGGGKYNTKGGAYYGKATNRNTIGIEVCSTNDTGKMTVANDSHWRFTDKVVSNLVELVKYLMAEYGIDAAHVIRHYDVNGKPCPGIIGWNEDTGSAAKWAAFKASLGAATPGGQTGGSTNTGTATGNTTLTYKVGDIVQFAGGKHYTNAQAASGTTVKPGPAKVTAVATAGKHPYHLVHTDSTSTVYGWVDAAAITGKASATPAAKTYTVKAGDSLWRIAAQQLGNGARYKEIKTLNGLKNNTIHAGQVLKLPN